MKFSLDNLQTIELHRRQVKSTPTKIMVLFLFFCLMYSFPHMYFVPFLKVFLLDRVTHLLAWSNDLESNDDSEYTGTHSTDYLPFVVSSGDYPHRGNYETGP